MLIINMTKPPGEQLTISGVEPGRGLDDYRGPVAIIERMEDGRLARLDMEDVLITYDGPVVELPRSMSLESFSMKGTLADAGGAPGYYQLLDKPA